MKHFFKKKKKKGKTVLLKKSVDVHRRINLTAAKTREEKFVYVQVYTRGENQLIFPRIIQPVTRGTTALWLHGFEQSTFTSVILVNMRSTHTSPTPYYICTHARKKANRKIAF